MPPRRIERLFTAARQRGLDQRPPVARASSCRPTVRRRRARSRPATSKRAAPRGRPTAVTSRSRRGATTRGTSTGRSISSSPTCSREMESLHRVTETGSMYSLPSWSPDGTRLACIRALSELDGPWHGRVVVLPAPWWRRDRAHRIPGSQLRAARLVAGAVLARTTKSLFLVEDRGSVHLWRAGASGATGAAARDRRRIRDHRLRRRPGLLAFVAIAPASLPELFVDAGRTERQLTDFTDGADGDGPHGCRSGAVHRVGRARSRRRLLDHRTRAPGGTRVPLAAEHPRRPVLALRGTVLRRVPVRGRRRPRRAVLQPARFVGLLGGVGPRDSLARVQGRSGFCVGRRRLRRHHRLRRRSHPSLRLDRSRSHRR